MLIEVAKHPILTGCVFPNISHSLESKVEEHTLLAHLLQQQQCYFDSYDNNRGSGKGDCFGGSCSIGLTVSRKLESYSIIIIIIIIIFVVALV